MVILLPSPYPLAYASKRPIVGGVEEFRVKRVCVGHSVIRWHLFSKYISCRFFCAFSRTALSIQYVKSPIRKFGSHTRTISLSREEFNEKAKDRCVNELSSSYTQEI